jgi:CO/xanthine dehydrogenase Mo-binding subunit
MQGGASQGIGWALNEEYIYNAKGAMENADFSTIACRLLRIFR